MASYVIREIALESLLIDPNNPRHIPQENQREAIATIASDKPTKLLNLAEDITEEGFNPTDLPIVTPIEGSELYLVREGNRRIVAIKLVSSPSLLASIGLSQNLVRRYKKLEERARGNLLTKVTCVIMSEEDAQHWIQLKHTGENNGIGVVPWDGIASQRFRGSSPALQAIGRVAASDFLDEESKKKLQKIPITTLGRLFSTPEARKSPWRRYKR